MARNVARNEGNVIKAAAGVKFSLKSGDGRKIKAPQIGLWDNAFDLAGTNVTLRNELEGNFVPDDARCFQLSLEDPSAAGKDFVEVVWRTVMPDGGALSAFSPGTITLRPLGGGSFSSAPLMLVSENSDLVAAVHSGLSADAADKTRGGARTQGMSDYRLRYADLTSAMEVSYPASNPTTVVRWPIFESYRTAPLVIYVMRKAVGGDPCTPLDDTFWGRLHITREIYARIGVHVTSLTETVPPGLNPEEQTRSLWGQTWTVYVVDPPAGINPADIKALELMTTIPDAYPGSDPQSCRAVYVTGLADDIDAGGIAMTQTYLDSNHQWDNGSAGKGKSGIFYMTRSAIASTTAHELGHVLINGGHMVNPNPKEPQFDKAQPAQTFLQNLMGMGLSDGWAGRKRLWDFKSVDDERGRSARQIERILRKDQWYLK